MSNVQLYLSIGIPSFTVFLALLIALFQNNRLADKLDRVADRLADKIDATNRELAATNREIAAVRGEIAAVRGEIAAVRGEISMVTAEHHSDFKMLMEQIVRLNERIAKVEN